MTVRYCHLISDHGPFDTEISFDKPSVLRECTGVVDPHVPKGRGPRNNSVHHVAALA